MDVLTTEESKEEEPEFAISCQLASKLTGTPEPGGKLLNFSMGDQKVVAIVENHAVANVDVLFHDTEEKCESKHAHKIGINATVASRETILEMQTLSKRILT